MAGLIASDTVLIQIHVRGDSSRLDLRDRFPRLKEDRFLDMDETGYVRRMFAPDEIRILEANGFLYLDPRKRL